MRIDVVTLFPQMFNALTGYGITGRAIERGLLQFGLVNPRDYTHDRHRTVDDRPYGGGPGMVMMPAPLKAAIHAAKEAYDGGTSRVIYLTPQGRKLTQVLASEMVAKYGHIVLVSGRYEGIDERLVQAEVDEELSIGDYVLSGGELAAMVMIDAITRLLPEALGHEDSARDDTFGQDGSGGMLEYPQYTRPEEFDGLKVPDVLLSGDHQAIRNWRMKQALGRTWLKRPDLLATIQLDDGQRQLLEEFIQEKESLI